MDKQLIERIAQAVYEGHRHAGRGIAQPFELMDQWQREMWLQAARAGAALVAEECAKIAETAPMPYARDFEPCDAAEAIRKAFKADA